MPSVGLPIRPFLYTLDQICTLLEVSEDSLKRQYLHFEGRSVGSKPPDRMRAVNILSPPHKPDWRVAEKELIRWMRYMGFRYHEKGYIQK